MNINDKGRDYAATAMTDNELDAVAGGYHVTDGMAKIGMVLTVAAVTGSSVLQQSWGNVMKAHGY
jgi:hypothetical protein